MDLVHGPGYGKHQVRHQDDSAAGQPDQVVQVGTYSVDGHDGRAGERSASNGLEAKNQLADEAGERQAASARMRVESLELLLCQPSAERTRKFGGWVSRRRRLVQRWRLRGALGRTQRLVADPSRTSHRQGVGGS